jgi:isochorismate synthase
MAIAFYKEPNQKPRWWKGKETFSVAIPPEFEGFVISNFNGNDFALLDADSECESVLFEDTFKPISFCNPNHSISNPDFVAYVELCKQNIQNGKYDKIVAARFEIVELPKGFSLQRLIELTILELPNAFICVYQGEKGTFISASPELLLSLNKDSAKTVALAGTALWEHRLELGAKEKEEQDFINLHSKSVLEQKGKSVTVSPKEVIKAGPLAHFYNTLSFAAQRSELNDLLAALHPTPAVGGYPMQPALAFIQHNEPLNRGFYAGFSGIISKESSVLSVNLRCAYFAKNHAFLFAGAGITKESDAMKEWKETYNKAQVMARLILSQH